MQNKPQAHVAFGIASSHLKEQPCIPIDVGKAIDFGMWNSELVFSECSSVYQTLCNSKNVVSGSSPLDFENVSRVKHCILLVLDHRQKGLCARTIWQ